MHKQRSLDFYGSATDGLWERLPSNDRTEVLQQYARLIARAVHGQGHRQGGTKQERPDGITQSHEHQDRCPSP